MNQTFANKSFVAAALAATIAAALGTVACGGSDDDAGGTGSITQAFQNNCARCHGANGTGAGEAPSLPGELAEPAFIATVRAGKGNGAMPAFSASQISDADLSAAYAALKAR